MVLLMYILSVDINIKVSKIKSYKFGKYSHKKLNKTESEKS